MIDNAAIAQKLMRLAQVRDRQRANLFRARAYRRAAETVLRLDRPVTVILEEEGPRGLRQLPGIGRRIATTIEELARGWGRDSMNDERVNSPGGGPCGGGWWICWR